MSKVSDYGAMYETSCDCHPYDKAMVGCDCYTGDIGYEDIYPGELNMTDEEHRRLMEKQDERRDERYRAHAEAQRKRWEKQMEENPDEIPF